MLRHTASPFIFTYLIFLIFIFLKILEGIAHRDIKPQNILFCLSQKLFKLGDFGEGKIITNFLSRETKEIRNHPFSNTVRGTPNFMSIEVYDSYKKNQGVCNHDPFASDLFSLGLTLLSVKYMEGSITPVERQSRIEKLDQKLESTKLIKALLETDPERRIQLSTELLNAFKDRDQLEKSQEAPIVELIELHRTKPLTNVQSAVKRLKIAEAYKKLYKFDKAKSEYKNLIEELKPLKDQEERLMLSEAFMGLGRVQTELFDLENSLENLKSALDIRQSFHDAKHLKVGEILNEIGFI
jgi:serine/threonine protein kinase